MTALARRGRTIFLVFATIVCFVESSSIIWTLSTNDWSYQILKSTAGSACMVLGIIWLWQGDQTIKWCAAIWLALTSLPWLLISVTAGGALLARTPLSQAGFWFRTVGITLAPFFIWGSICLTFSAMLLLSPSIKAFFAHQLKADDSGFVSLADWIFNWQPLDKLSQLSLVENVLRRLDLDHGARWYRGMLRRMRNRPRYEKLTIDPPRSCSRFGAGGDDRRSPALEFGGVWCKPGTVSGIVAKRRSDAGLSFEASRRSQQRRLSSILLEHRWQGSVLGE